MVEMTSNGLVSRVGTLLDWMDSALALVENDAITDSYRKEGQLVFQTNHGSINETIWAARDWADEVLNVFAEAGAIIITDVDGASAAICKTRGILTLLIPSFDHEWPDEVAFCNRVFSAIKSARGLVAEARQKLTHTN